MEQSRLGEPVEQGSCEAFRAEALGPLLEGQIAGYHRRTSLVAQAEDLEEQFSAGIRERNEAQLIDKCGAPHSSMSRSS